MKELTYNRLTHHSFREEYALFKSLYTKLFFDTDLTKEDKNKVLEVVVLFSNQSDELLKKLSYRMALAYGLKTDDYTPLYDISINTGLIPLVALLCEIKDLPFGSSPRSEFLSSMMDSYIDNFRVSNIVQTEQQFVLSAFFLDNIKRSAIIIAPTSYGKSELIISAIEETPNKRTCVIVPSKALLAQTRKQILDARIQWVQRLVSHPEMYREKDDSSVYVLTQERLTRLLNQNKNLYFDVVIVDEAHNILEKDNRNTLLASVVRILENRNSNTAFKFLTPFLQDPASLKLKGSRLRTDYYKVNEYIKSERFYIADYREDDPKTVFYDHFINESIELRNDCKTPVEYIKEWSLNKNIIYFNRPKHIQIFAKQFADSLPEIESIIVEEAIKEIAANTHDHYLLLHCLKHGVLYHHGSMTDGIRNYAEYIYRSCDEVKYLISSSTLLEGVNLPIERMFLLDIRKGIGNLRASQFKNLIGRVCRFNEIFTIPTLVSLEKLQPEIHIVGTHDFLRKDANLSTFIEKVMSITKKDKDTIENVLLEGTEIDDNNREESDRQLTRLENLEEGITGDEWRPTVSTEIGMKLLENNISEIDIFLFEKEIQQMLEEFGDRYGQISDSNTLMSVIYESFISFIERNHTNQTKSLTRLESDKAQTFYAMFLDWNIKKTPLGVMIGRFVKYWDHLPKNTPVFIGSWGDVAKEGSKRKVFTYISEKSPAEKINLAIVRIKEEEDFFDHFIFRFVEILNEIGLMDKQFYKLAKYSTTDKKTITMIQNGFSRGVAELLRKHYSDYFQIKDGDIVSVDPSIHERLVDDGVGFLQRHEVSLNVKTS